MKPDTRSIVIVGAGVFGVTAALELRRRGWRVTMVDPGPVPRPAAASTDISKVVRMDYGADELYTAMGEAALYGWIVERAWGAPLSSGRLPAAHDGEDAAGGFEHESFELLRRRGHAPERIQADDLPADSPVGRQQIADGYFSPRAGWVESGQALARLAADAAAHGMVSPRGSRSMALWKPTTGSPAFARRTRRSCAPTPCSSRPAPGRRLG